ncbi:cofilin, partial [Podila humilis]
SSGVGVNDDCLSIYQELKIGKKHRYVIYKLSDDLKAIEVAKTSGSSSTYEDFIAELPEDDCRYAVYDFAFEAKGGAGQRNKIVFITWSPSNSKIKAKMVYASSKDSLRRALQGIAVEVQGTDYDEVSFDTVLE